MSSSRIVLVFPGQGAQQPDMLEGLRGHEKFSSSYGLVCEVLGFSPLEKLAAGDTELLSRNAISSLMTVLASSLSLEFFRDSGKPMPELLAGYSIGQWTALYAAGCIEFEPLLRLIKARAEFMDDCAQSTPGGMAGVIGVDEDDVEQVCQEVREEGYGMAISNYNADGQYSIAGSLEAIPIAIEKLEQRDAIKVVQLPVSGAWHCGLLNKAAERFGEYLQDVELSPAQLPLADNVSGELLPDDADGLRRQMAQHVCSPVRWHQCIEGLVERGGTEFVEVGYGNLLTKFGFFIDRSVEHRNFYTS